MGDVIPFPIRRRRPKLRDVGDGTAKPKAQPARFVRDSHDALLRALSDAEKRWPDAGAGMFETEAQARAARQRMRDYQIAAVVYAIAARLASGDDDGRVAALGERLFALSALSVADSEHYMERAKDALTDLPGVRRARRHVMDSQICAIAYRLSYAVERPRGGNRPLTLEELGASLQFQAALLRSDP